jgi:hypothetical protein
MKIDKNKLYKLYIQKINKISEDCEVKTHFTPKECVDLVSSILESNPQLVSYPEPQPSETRCVGADFNPKKYKLAYKRAVDMEGEEEEYNCEYYILGIIDPSTNEFLDFYYSSGIEYEEFDELIPKGFAEAMESCYEFKVNKKTTAKEILKKYGYVNFDELTLSHET